jgi:hypothetical protein
MFARLIRTFCGNDIGSTNRYASRARFGSGFELLEDRAVPSAITVITTFQVNTTDDTAFAGTTVINGITTPVDANGNTSLRAVVEYANANPHNGNWNNNRYNVDLSLVAGGTISLTALGTLELNTNFNFLGNDVTVTRSAGAGRIGLFQVDQSTESHFVNMTFKNGLTNTSGGAIYDAGALQVLDCFFKNNYAFQMGGAIAAIPSSSSGTVTAYITNSEFDTNTAEIAGGAIASSGATVLTIEGCTITANQVTGVGVGAGFGGGVAVSNTFTTLINQTDIIGNTATQSGGGLSFQSVSAFASLTMNDGQLKDNEADSLGGGIYVDAFGNTASLNGVSVTLNRASGAGGKGGGGYVLNGTLDGTLTALTDNQDGAGVNGPTAGIAFKQANGATAPIAVPPNQQTVVAD